MREACERLQIGDRARRVADRFDKEQFRVRPDRGAQRVEDRRPAQTSISMPIRLSVTLNCVTVPP